MADDWKISEGCGARWIFPALPEDAVNQYVDFLHVFDCDGAVPDAQLVISADTDFCAWLNGELIGCGQYSDYPGAKTYESFPLKDVICDGSNSLALTVFYNGRTSSVYIRGEPGLIFEIRDGDRVIASSGTGTLCRKNPCYHSGPIAIVSGQLAYTFGYDARGEDDFTQPGYHSSSPDWRWVLDSEARVPKSRSNLGARPVPQLREGEITGLELVECGRFRYDATLAESGTGSEAAGQMAAGLRMTKGDPVSPAWQMQNALLSKVPASELLGAASVSRGQLREGLRAEAEDLDGRHGLYLIFDMGQQEVGHIELDLEAPEGTIVDIAYGEHLDDGHVRSFINGRNFAGRYICGNRRRAFRHRFLRWAGRYLQIHVHSRSFILHGLGLRRRYYPLGAGGEIDTGSDLRRRIEDVCRRTLHLCMHEHYEDTPWREQALYANDARTQALCGYYAFGETAMPRASFDLLGCGLRDDGFLDLTAPGQPSVTIPSFTFIWMMAVRDYQLYSGDDSLSQKFLPQISAMLESFISEMREGLLPLREERRIWQFYDWSAGMSGYSKEEREQGLNVDAPLNCFFILALEAANQMLAWSGLEPREDFVSTIKTLQDSVADRFWAEPDGVFRTNAYRKRLTELTQALAVLAKVGDETIRETALARLGDPGSGLAEPGLSQSYYTFEAMMTRKEKYGAEVIRRIEKVWGRMLDAGATTFWETITGASDFNDAGSLCHGWSAVPVYVLYHDVLGVKPVAPGFREFAVDPLPGAMASCSGRVPVPGGEISVKWERLESGEFRREISAPAGIACV